MKVALLQQDIVWADPEANRRRLQQLLDTLPEDVDLCVFPEMFSTGFATAPAGIAEKSPSQTLEWMKAEAAKRGFALAGSIAVEEDGKFYNRFHFVTPDGVITYNKRHLFTFGGEDKTFTAGDDRVVVEWRGVRFLLLVCYDLRFPVWIRSRKDYDAVICVANWPDVRRYAWDALARARAIENQCFMLAVNRCGDDPSCHYDGGTALLDPYGKVVASSADSKEEFTVAELDMNCLEGFRKVFPVLSDADSFEIQL